MSQLTAIVIELANLLNMPTDAHCVVDDMFDTLIIYHAQLVADGEDKHRHGCFNEETSHDGQDSKEKVRVRD